MQVFAVLPQGLESQGAQELSAFGAQMIRPLRRGVDFEADLACFYRLHLLARLPFRFLRQMARFVCNSPDSLYLGIRKALDWETWLPPSMSFRVDVSGYCDGLNHSYFTALQVKNALVDLQRERWGERSCIDLETPDLCIHLHLNNSGAVLSFDTSSGSLHKRGYRAAMGAAPIKENLAAGLIRTTAWDGSLPLIDPLCGSGTFLIEAASMALDLAPRLGRKFLFENWPDFDSGLWQKEQLFAKHRENNNNHRPLLIGCELDESIAKQAQENVLAAGLQEFVSIKSIHFRELQLPYEKGMIICNPPYGKRIGFEEDLKILYEELGAFAKKRCSGWELWLLSGNSHLTRSLKLKSKKKFPISNGGIDCRWLNYEIN